MILVGLIFPGELLGRWEQAGTAVGQGETSYAAEEEMRLGREQSVQVGIFSMRGNTLGDWWLLAVFCTV